MIRVLFHFFLKKKLKVTSTLKVAFIFFCLLWYGVSGFLYYELPLKPDLKWQDALWWAIVTMTTVGYGDIFPASNGGRYLIGIPIMTFGIGLLGFVLSETATSFIEYKSKRRKGMARVLEEKHLVIINFVALEKITNLIHEITSDQKTKDIKIVIIDEHLHELPLQLVEKNIIFVKGDPANSATLDLANIQKAAYSIILANNPADSHSDNLTLAVTLMVKKINPEISTVVECVDPMRKDHLEAAGCDSIICISSFSVALITQELQDHGVQDVIAELTSNTFGNQIYLVPIKKLIKWKYNELHCWSLEKCYTILGIRREKINIINPDMALDIEAKDRAIIIAKHRPAEISI